MKPISYFEKFADRFNFVTFLETSYLKTYCWNWVLQTFPIFCSFICKHIM